MSAEVAFFGLRFLEGWSIGQLLSEGAGVAQLGQAGRRMSSWEGVCRILASLAAASFLAVAAWRNRVTPPTAPTPPAAPTAPTAPPSEKTADLEKKET